MVRRTLLCIDSIKKRKDKKTKQKTILNAVDVLNGKNNNKLRLDLKGIVEEEEEGSMILTSTIEADGRDGVGVPYVLAAYSGT